MRNPTLKRVAKELVPPLLVRGYKAFRRSSGQTTEEVEGRERPPAFYDRRFRKNDRWRKHYTESRYYFMWSVIADRVVRADVESVLDIGCGPGQLAALLRDKGLKSYLGFDFSSERIEQARVACPEFDFALADAFETDLFETRSYDAVICTEFLEHVDGDTDVLAKLPSGTHFFGSVPNFPGKGHVRHFEAEQEVEDRYAPFFRSLRTDTFLRNTEGKKYFLMEGNIA